MRKNKLQTAKDLAESHSRVDPCLRRVCLLEPANDQDPKEPIKLLEVVEGTIERGIEPVAFTRNPGLGIEYPSIIVEISPTEYEAIQNGKLDFGTLGWTVGQELWPAAG